MRAGREHVVDQDEPAAGDLGLALGGTRTRPAHCGRARLGQPDLLRGALTRLSAYRATGTPLLREIAFASSADWLKRRAHSRRQCSGTGRALGVRQEFAAGARHPAAHGGREVEPVAIFERVHQRARDVVVAHAPGARWSGGRIGDRLHRQHAAGRDRRRRECRAARNRAAAMTATAWTSRRRSRARRRRPASRQAGQSVGSGGPSTTASAACRPRSGRATAARGVRNESDARSTSRRASPG